MPVAPDDVLRATLRGDCFGQQILLDLTYVCSVGSVAPVNDVLDEFLSLLGPGAATIQANYLDCLPPSYTMRERRAQMVTPVRTAYRSVFTNVANVGTAGAATTANDATAITRRTNSAGRSQVSTLKIGPMPDGSSVGGAVTAGYIGVLGTLAFSTLLTQILPVTGAQFVPCIVNRNNQVLGRLLTSFRVGQYSRVNRRRTVGIGS